MAPQPDAAVANYRRQQQIIASTALLSRRVWQRLSGDFDAAWATLGAQLLLVVSAGQRAAALQASEYVPAVIAELNIETDVLGSLVTSAFSGIASDGRDLAELLFQPVVATRTALGQNISMQQAMSYGQRSLDRIVTTQVADSGRAAESVESMVRPRVTRYVRMLVPPSCDRCAILAGRIYKSAEAFDRHPHCDCRHIPCDENVAGDLTTDPRAAIEADRVTGLSQADKQAILDGADPGKVVNARRGMYTEQGNKFTREGTRRRGSPRNRVRLRPESIYKIAHGDRAEILRLLRLHGYII